MDRFSLPRDIFHGPGSLSYLKTLPGTRALICYTGSSLEKNGTIDKIRKYLEYAGMRTKIFNNIEINPSLDCVEEGAKAMFGFLPDVIIAVGGNSVMDAAKAMWVKYEIPDITFEEIFMLHKLPKMKKGLYSVLSP